MSFFTNRHKIGQVPIWLLFGFFAQSVATETICTTALIGIVDAFGVSSNLAQTSSSVYFAGFALGILTFGPLSDRVGRRPVVLLGLFIYVLANITLTMSNDIYMFITMRFFQAIGASVGSVMAQAMARDSYRGSELSYVYATVSLSLAFVPALGATLGGFMVQYLGWRYNFMFLLSVGVVMFILSSIRLPETNNFLRTGRREKYSTIFRVVITDRLVWLHAMMVGCYAGLLFGFYLAAPFIFIDFLNITPSKYGMLTGCLTFSALCGGLANRYFVRKGMNNDKLLRRGLLFGLSGCVLLCISSILLIYKLEVSKYVAALMLLLPMMAQSASHSIVIPLALRFALEDYAKVNGTAGSIFGFLYYCLVATINFLISKLQTESFLSVIVLFLILSAIANLAFAAITYLKPRARRTIFADE